MLDDGQLSGTVRTGLGQTSLVHTASSQQDAENIHRRVTRSSISIGQSRTVCSVYLHADETFFKAWGGSGSLSHRVSTTIAKMVNLLHNADAIFSDPLNFGKDLGFIIAGAKVLSDVSFSENEGYASADRLLTEYQYWLSEQQKNDTDLVKPCLYQLFTHTPLMDSILGSSTMGLRTEGAQGGACAHTTNLINRRDVSSNAGVISSIQQGKPASVPALVHTLVHEIGHSFGAQHTCCRGDKCALGTSCKELEGSVCNPSISKYVMHPLLATGANKLLFSECSKRSIFNFLQIVDCMTLLHPCAYGGACCDGSTLRSQGTMCRQADPSVPCSKPAYCNGQ